MLAAFHTANPEPGQTSSKSRIQRLGAAVLAVPLPDEFPNRIAQIARLWAELHEADPDLANELAWRLPDTEIHRHD